MEDFKIIAKTFQGLEEVLAKELIGLGANNVEIGRRMVAFTGDKEMLYKANFCTRTAVKVLKPIKEFKATDADEVYEVVKKMDWSQYMDVDNTFLVDSVIFSESFRHSRFVAYRVKDAIADYWREKTNGKRPNVGISNPDIQINIHIADNDVTVSLDSSGESLHQRGYKTASVPAPINEVLAAGLIMLTGWDGECDLIDPFCGSGTILIEAALIAQNIYPGVFRKGYAFEKWKDFDADLFDRIYNDDSQEREFEHKIYGYDINRQAVQIATENVVNAGVKDIVSVEQHDFYEFEQPAEKAIMITNPPYGDRITTDDIYELYEMIGKNLKRCFVGNDAWIISHHEELFAKIGFRPSTKFALFNGALECEFRKYQIFEGRLKERREEGLDIKSEEDRMRNLKFKPHKKNEDGEWGGERRTDDEEHYFKSRPFGRDQRPYKMYEAMDEEEAEIINRHLGKWGDRRVRVERKDDKRPRRREERDGKWEERRPRRNEERSNDRMRSHRPENDATPDRASRQEARKAFFSSEGNQRKPYGEGRREHRDERRPRRDDDRPARRFGKSEDGNRPFRGKRGDRR